MKTEIFLEKLIRLAFESGWSLPNLEKIETVLIKDNSYLVECLISYSSDKVMVKYAGRFDLERIIFDKEWLHIVCGLLLEKFKRETGTDGVIFSGYNIPSLDFLVTLISQRLLRENDRPAYLQEAFGSLVEDNLKIEGE